MKVKDLFPFEDIIFRMDLYHIVDGCEGRAKEFRMYL